MAVKQITGERFRQFVLRGVNSLTDAVKTTLNAKGRSLLNGIRESAKKIHSGESKGGKQSWQQSRLLRAKVHVNRFFAA
jgi:hypothetical protein